MDDKYYRSVIDAVNRNEKGMWDGSEDSNEGFDDFKNLWNILNDEEADVMEKPEQTGTARRRRLGHF